MYAVKCVFIFTIFIFLWCNLGGTAINHFQWKHHNHFMLFPFSTEKQTKKTPCVPLTDKNNNWHFKMCTSYFIYAWNTWCMFVEHSISTLALSFTLSPPLKLWRCKQTKNLASRNVNEVANKRVVAKETLSHIIINTQTNAENKPYVVAMWNVLFPSICFQKSCYAMLGNFKCNTFTQTKDFVLG